MVPSGECWRLLETRSVGRLAVVVDDQPEIVPVNYLVVDSAVVFRTEGGTKLHALESHHQVAFEADEIDGPARTGWSVMVKGKAEEIRDPAPLRHLRAMPLDVWASGERPHWIRIVPFEITGRRILHR